MNFGDNPQRFDEKNQVNSVNQQQHPGNPQMNYGMPQQQYQGNPNYGMQQQYQGNPQMYQNSTAPNYPNANELNYNTNQGVMQNNPAPDEKKKKKKKNKRKETETESDSESESSSGSDDDKKKKKKKKKKESKQPVIHVTTGDVVVKNDNTSQAQATNTNQNVNQNVNQNYNYAQPQTVVIVQNEGEIPHLEWWAGLIICILNFWPGLGTLIMACCFTENPGYWTCQAITHFLLAFILVGFILSWVLGCRVLAKSLSPRSTTVIATTAVQQQRVALLA
jgi:uncharacterized membrane protein